MRYIKFKFLLFLIIGVLAEVKAQDFLPALGEVYRGDVVPEIRIYVSEDTLDWLYASENLFSDKYFKAVVVFDNGTVRDEFYDVGFRLRGNTSRHAKKKSFRLSFNTFVSGRTYHGVEKMNLVGEANDPSSMRAITCFEIYRRSNLIASRANHCNVYINDRYYGVYSNLEHYDEEFTNLYFGTKTGNLYKCSFGADLRYRGENQESYKFHNGQGRVYDLNNQSGIDNYSDLVHFIKVLNLTPDEDFICEFEKIFELNDYLKYMAIDILTGNWDGPLYNKNNFYLFNNPITGKFHYLPYDLDNTLGIDWVDREWHDRDIYSWGHETEARPLYDRIIKIPALRDRLSYFLLKLTDEIFTNGELSAFLFYKRTLIENWIKIDPYKSLDYGYTYDDFRQSLLQPNGGHVKNGIIPFIDRRRSSAKNQLTLHKIDPAPDKGKLYYINSGQNILAKVRVQSDVDIAEVKLLYRLKGENLWESMDLFKGEESTDFMDFNFYYETVFNDFPEEGEYEYYFETLDISGASGHYPSCGYKQFIYQKAHYTLAINEFMASNGNIISDEYGDYDDWVELYNYGVDPMQLSGLYLSDRINNPSKWQLPDYTMQPGEYLLIWADGETHQGMFHASFSLSIDGEDLILSASDGTDGYITIDELTFGVQQRNISFGRYPDANGPMGFMAPTPGSTNTSLISSNRNYQYFSDAYRLFPNPVNESLNIEALGDTDIIDRVEIISVSGKQCLFIEYEVPDKNVCIPVTALPQGIYIIILNNKYVEKLVKY